MNKPILIQRHSIRRLLTKKTLKSILDAANDAPLSAEGDLEFSRFQQFVIHKIFPGFTYQFCTTSKVELSDSGDISGLKTTNLNLPGDIVANYLMYADLDELSPLVYANPGRALNYTHVCRMERVKEHPFFINHCLKYGIHHAISVGYMHPGHENTFIAFDYMGDEHNKNWVPFSHVKVELASFPFALAWLYREGKFDQSMLEKFFLLLEGLTENKFLNLRKYINAPLQNYDQQADCLGIKASTLKEDIAITRNLTMEKLGLRINEKGNTPNRVLDQHFGFLQMLGDHTNELVKIDSTPKIGVLTQ